MAPSPLLSLPDSTLVVDLHPSPNIELRKSGSTPDLLLLHYTGMSSARKAIEWLSRPESKVSAHYVIDVDGRITQLVAEDLRAWHAGVSNWSGETDINSLSIGIEIQNPGHADGYATFGARQMAAVAALSADIVRRRRIKPVRVLAHSDVAPLRKIDPGEKFDWRWLNLRGVGHWVEPQPVDELDAGLAGGASDPAVADMQRMLRHYGYDCDGHGLLDPKTEAVVRAFQRHFRPARVDGRIDRSSRETLERLIASARRVPAA
ncbi:MAG: N-acetylmuramoyl-L-alanine amidase [Hyphomicrobium sp.]|nr:MAG: N-acetylmuramoyl-L-alanine amidase [Hyphomicrobium sp.]